MWTTCKDCPATPSIIAKTSGNFKEKAPILKNPVKFHSVESAWTSGGKKRLVHVPFLG